MSEHDLAFSRCRAFIDSNFLETHPAGTRRPRVITISREAYSCTHEIAEMVIKLLDADPKMGASRWALFDRELVLKVLEDHNLPKRLARYMHEERDNDFTGVINEILGLHPSLWELFQHVCDTIRKLAKVGNVIIIGRGGHIITRGMPHVLHVRIIAPFEQRAERAAKALDIPLAKAEKLIRKEERHKAAFITSHFDEPLDNPLAYHLGINTGLVPPKAAARLIVTAVKNV